jgi:acyl-CoA thioesterase-1
MGFDLINLIRLTLLVLSLGMYSTSYADSLDQKKETRIIVYGDSISAAYGMDLDKGYVNMLGNSLPDRYEVINASVSGDTTVAGLARLPVTIKELSPDLVLLELGANDGLQGLPINEMQRNLSSMIELLIAADVQVVLLGLTLPASYGPRYIDQFRAVFPALAEQYNIPWLDLYREQFVLEDGYIQIDGLHPTEKAQPIIYEMVRSFLADHNLIGQK